jgi:hypothetical protein
VSIDKTASGKSKYASGKSKYAQQEKCANKTLMNCTRPPTPAPPEMNFQTYETVILMEPTVCVLIQLKMVREFADHPKKTECAEFW